MFESDDFDEVLSQFDLPDGLSTENYPKSNNGLSDLKTNEPDSIHGDSTRNLSSTVNAGANYSKSTSLDSPKHTKRKIINSHFNNKNKRKFPGPAGLLSGNLENNDDSVSHIEFLSQDVNFTQNNIVCNGFESPLWKRLTEDIRTWSRYKIDSINSIKQEKINGIFRCRKAQTVVALVETVDRSPTDPLVILRDETGHIKCTLHRDAWSNFSSYIVPGNSALVLWRPTILTTGSAFKKYYLNITLSNIFALYSSTITNKENESDILPVGFRKTCDEDVTIIKTDKDLPDIDSSGDPVSGENILLDELDNIFSDDAFQGDIF